MQTVALSAQTRTGTGKQVTRKLRSQGPSRPSSR